MRAIIAAAALGLSVLALASASFGADEYKIKLDRPSHVGDSTMVSITVTMKSSQKVEIGGQAQEQKNNFTAVLEGTRTVDAVTEKGGDLKVSVKVTKCTKDGAELVPAGSTIVAENVDGKTEFKIDGTEAANDAKPVLAELIDTTKPDEPTSDEVMGTDKPQKVGDTWLAKTDVLAKEISDGPIQLTGDQIKAESKLTDVSSVDGKAIETIKTTVTADVPKKDPNNGANVHDLKIDVEVTGTIPVDEKSHEATMKMTRAISFKMDTPGPVVTITVNSTKDEKITEVKK